MLNGAVGKGKGGHKNHGQKGGARAGSAAKIAKKATGNALVLGKQFDVGPVFDVNRLIEEMSARTLNNDPLELLVTQSDMEVGLSDNTIASYNSTTRSFLRWCNATKCHPPIGPGTVFRFCAFAFAEGIYYCGLV
jgi:hypothetical protein